MIWHSTALMTAGDFVIIGLVGFALRGCFAHRSRMSSGEPQAGASFVLLGFCLLSLPYLLDLMAMWLLPLFVPRSVSMAFKQDVHLNYAWFTTVGGTLFIATGCTLGRRSFSSLRGRLRESLAALRDSEKESAAALRSTEAQLRHAQKLEAVGQLTAGVAHDFNNLLTVIGGNGQIVRSELSDEDPVSQMLDEIVSASESAASLTRQLLAFSRREVLQPEILDLNRVIDDVSKMLRRLLGEDIDLSVVNGPGLGTVSADPGQLEQIIVNLAVNARDAMPGGGQLTLSTCNATLDEAYAREHAGCRPGEYVMLAVSDTGTGIPHDKQSLVFEPFYTTKSEGKGTGLGLSTTFGIVKQSGGYIELYSEPGHGTAFKIYLPREDDGLAAVATEITAGQEHVRNGNDPPGRGF